VSDSSGDGDGPGAAEQVTGLPRASGARWRRILLAVEPSGPSASALDMARALALPLQAEVLMVCAIELHPRYDGLRADRSEPARQIDEAVSTLGRAGLAARGEVLVTLVGEGARAIAETATTFGAELVIVASRRAPLLVRALGASFAQRMARVCAVPVLLLPDEPAHQP